jgi:hypothetical protein
MKLGLLIVLYPMGFMIFGSPCISCDGSLAVGQLAIVKLYKAAPFTRDCSRSMVAIEKGKDTA